MEPREKSCALTSCMYGNCITAGETFAGSINALA